MIKLKGAGTMKTFLKRTTILILVMMTLINAIVPNGTFVFATDQTPTDEMSQEESTNTKFSKTTLRKEGKRTDFFYDVSVQKDAGTGWWVTYVKVKENGYYVFDNSATCAAIAVLETDNNGNVTYSYGDQLETRNASAAGFGEGYGQVSAYTLETGTVYAIFGYQIFDDGNRYNGPVYMVNPDKVQEFEEYSGNASLIERLITVFLLTLGDGVMWAIGVVAGGEINLDKLFFNEYGNTRLLIFKDQDPISGARSNSFLDGAGVVDTINRITVGFRVIAVTAYVTVLLYIGIRVLLGCTAGAKSKYKELLLDWLRGLIMLFVFPIVMKYVIELNDAAVVALKNVQISNDGAPKIPYRPGGLSFPLEFGGSMRKKPQDYMEALRFRASKEGRAIYALCWLILIFELIKFIFIYFKRLLMTLFLVSVFPLVMISYALDKIKDGKSQVFDRWFKEYVLNVVLQLFHALNYVVVMGLIFAVGGAGADGNANYILVLVGITYIAKGEDILRHIFGQDKSAGGTVKSAAESMLKASAAVSVAKKLGKGAKNTKKRIGGLIDKGRGISDRTLKWKQNRINEREDRLAASANPPPPLEAFYLSEHRRDGIGKDVKTSINAVINAKDSPEELKKALAKLVALAADPNMGRELGMQLLAMGAQGQDIKDLMAQSEALDGLILNVNVKQNLDILIKRKKGKDGKLRTSSYNQMSDNLLAAYGLTNKALTSERNKISKKMEKLERTNKKRIKSSNAMTDTRTRLSYESASSSMRDGNVRGGAVNNQKGQFAATGASESTSARAGGRSTNTNASTSKKKRTYKMMKNQSTSARTTQSSQNSTTQNGNTADPVKKTYAVSKNEVVGKRKTTAQKIRTRKAVERRRREQAAALEGKAVEARQRRMSSPTTAEQRENYAQAASRVVDMNSPISTPTEIIKAHQKFDDVAAQIRSLQGLNPLGGENDDAGVKALESEIRNDTKAAQIAEARERKIKSMTEQAERINKDKVSDDMKVEYREIATAVDTMNDGRASLNELWEARDTYVDGMEKYGTDKGVKQISSELFKGGSSGEYNLDINEYSANLAVETLNNIHELSGDLREKQQIVDKCIRIVREHAKDGGITGEILSGLKYDASKLELGKMPTVGKEKKTESKAVKQIEDALNKLRSETRGEGTIYDPGKNYDAEKEKKKIRQELHTLGVDAVKEVTRDTLGVVGGVTTTAAYLAYDKSVSASELAGAMAIGGTGGAKAGESVIQFVDNTSYRIKKGIKALRKENEKNEENRGENPIQLYNDNGKVKRKK